MACRAVHAEQEPVTVISGRGIDPERGILLIGDTPQLPVY
jgi:hypothetical protein